MQATLEAVINASRSLTSLGQVATYIPELANSNPHAIGVAVSTLDGRLYQAGDYDLRFTLQSVSKVFALMLALQDRGADGVFSRIGMEPTGDAFNSIVKLETFSSLRPLNPLINAGAIATTALIQGRDVDERFQRLYDFIAAIAGPEKVGFNERVYRSEKATGDRNRAIGYFLRDIHAISGDVDDVLDLYFRQCSIETDVEGLSRLARRLAQGPEADPPLSAEILRIARTFMYTCGMYDASGEFAIKVGIPAKSGVSGAIMAVVPRQMGIGVIAPALDEKGNSLAGVRVLRDLAQIYNLAVLD
ncbi:MAG: glutaminase A [Bacillota bacterium]|jgi:glutaminase